VVDLSLEDFQKYQSNQISRDIIGQSEAHEQKMQIEAQKLWVNAHQHLVTLLRFMDQDYDESCEKANRPLESFSDNDLAYLIHVRLRAWHGKASEYGKPGDVIEIKRNLEEITQKYAVLEQELLNSKEKNKKIQGEKTALEVHLSALRQAQKIELTQDNQSAIPDTYNPTNLTYIPDWMKTWQERKTFEKTSTAILVMGDMGMALRPSIIREMAKRLSVSETNKSLNEGLNWLIVPEENSFPILIEAVHGTPEQGSSSGGNQPAVLHLTTHGRFAYQTLTGKIPEENEYDILIKQHSSPEHTILNIQAAEILVETGYFIRGKAQEIQLSNGETYIPDIIAADPKTGGLIFVEIERDTHKDQISRKQKWMKLFEASNGNLYVFCDNLNCQRAIQGEINLALGELVYNSFLTNLHGIRKGKRSEKDGSIWFSQRRGCK